MSIPDLEPLSAGVGVELPAGLELVGGSQPVRTAAATALQVDVDASRLRIRSSPPLVLDAVWPLSDVDLRGATWSLARGEVEGVDARNRQFAVPLAGTVRRVLTRVVEDLLVGSPMGHAGYNPFGDRDLVGTLAQMQAHLALGSVEASDVTRAEALLSSLRRVRLSASARVPAGFRQQTDGGSGVDVRPGATIEVSALLAGSLADHARRLRRGEPPRRLERVFLRSDGVQALAAGEPVAAIRELSIEGDGSVSVRRVRPLGRVGDVAAAEHGVRALARMVRARLLHRGVRLPGGPGGPLNLTEAALAGALEGVLNGVVRDLLGQPGRALVGGVDLAQLFDTQADPVA